MLDFSPYQKDIARLFQDGLDLERLRDKTILVVGATGLVGGCVVDVLMQNPARCYKVIAAGRNKERAKQKFAAYWEDESFFCKDRCHPACHQEHEWNDGGICV